MMGKIRYITTQFDKSVWVNKADILKLLEKKGYGKKDLTKDLESCYYKEIMKGAKNV